PHIATLLPYTTLFRSHGTRVEPGVEHRRHTPHGALARRLGAGPGDRVDVRPVQVEAGEVAAGQLRELCHGPDARLVAAIGAPPRSEEHTSELQSRENL